MDLPTEIERRFIASFQDLEEAMVTAPKVFITDVYVEAENTPPLRIRTSMPAPAGILQIVASVKLGEGIKRIELQWSLKSFPGRLAEGPTLEKTRYVWCEGARNFHVEQILYPTYPTYPIMAEVEFPSEEDAATFVPPAHWVEVTGDKRYSNFSIAKHGWPGYPK